MPAKYKYNPNSRNQLRKKAKKQLQKERNEAMMTAPKPMQQQQHKKALPSIVSKKKSTLRKLKKMQQSSSSTNADDFQKLSSQYTPKSTFQIVIKSQVQQSGVLQILSETLNPFTPNTVAESLLTLYENSSNNPGSMQTEHQMDTQMQDGTPTSVKIPHNEMIQLWKFMGEWCLEVSPQIWQQHQQILVQKYRDVHDERVIGCLVRSFYQENNQESQQWCSEAMQFVFDKPSAQDDTNVAESFACMLHLKRKSVVLTVSQLLKQKCAEYQQSSASKRDWVRLFSILNVTITMLPSNDVVHFSRIILKLLLQSGTPVEVKIVALKVFEDMYSSSAGSQSGEQPLPPLQSFQIVKNLFKCKFVPNNQLNSTLALSYCKLLKSALLSLYQIDAQQCLQQLLPEFYLKMLSYLNSPHNDIRYDTVANVACRGIRDIVNRFISQQMVMEAVELSKTQASSSHILLTLIGALGATLSVEFRPQFPRILQLIQNFIEKLGRSSCILMKDILVKVDSLYQHQDPDLTFSLEKTLSTAVKFMGVDAFMKILPLGKKSNPRLWMFRLFHSHIANNSLRTYQKTFYPKIAKLEKKVLRCLEAGNQKEAARLNQLINELWNLMPDFFVLPLDLTNQVFGEYVQLWTHVFSSVPKRQNVVCRSIMRLIQTNVEFLDHGESLQNPEASQDSVPFSSTISQFRHSVPQYNRQMAQDALNLVSNHAETLFPALFTIYSSADKDTSLRDVVSNTITLIASVSETSLVCAFFKRILIKMLKAANEENSGMNTDNNAAHTQQLIMLDLAGALAPYLDEATSQSFYGVLKNMMTSFDRSLQKKSNKALMHMCSKNANFVSSHGAEVLSFLCGILSQCDPAAKKYRLSTLRALIVGVPPQHIMQNMSHLIGEGLISAKEISTESRASALDFLDTLFRRVVFGDAELDVSEIAVNEELSKTACDFMKALVSGLGGMGHEMVSATIDIITHLLNNYLEFIEPIAESLFRTIVLLLEFPNVGVVSSAIRFVKMCLVDFDPSFFEPQLQTMVPYLCGAIERHSRVLKRTKLLFERLITIFDGETIENVTPEEHKKLIRSIAREMRRSARKKVAEKEKLLASSKSTSINVDGNLDLNSAAAVKNEDADDDMEDEDMVAIKSGKDAEISIAKSGRVVVGGKRKREEVQMDDYDLQDGGDMSDEDKKLDFGDSSAAQSASDFESRKRLRLSADASAAADDELNLYDPHSRHYLEIKQKQKARRDPLSKVSMGKEFKSKKKNARGDVKKGKMDPYAYLPLDPMQMNRRRRNKRTVFDRFEKETKKR